MTIDKQKINEKGHLVWGGADTVELAERFSTPLYVFDEQKIRSMMRIYRRALDMYYGGYGLILYASKAFAVKAMYAIAQSEGLGADVVSGGELYTALSVGFPASKLVMHGNNKLPAEIGEGVEAGVGRIVLDGTEEIFRVEEAAAARGKVQKVLLRINPGVEAHTHTFVQTATPDSKFGFSVACGDAERAVRLVLSQKHLELKGFHCHIGSQIFEKQSFVVAAEKCIAFMASLKDFCCEELNLGGGFGIRYTGEDADLSEADRLAFLAAILKAVSEGCEREGLKKPFVYFEPGRSIVGEAGITLYRVGNIRTAAETKYLAIDGGMFDNPRYCLYGSKYSALLANRAGEEGTERVALAGKCCESGDLIGRDFLLPSARVGDLVAVLSTGAYNYSMASNYNRNKIPPAVLVRDGDAGYIVRPQTYEDLVRLDGLPERLKN